MSAFTPSSLDSFDISTPAPDDDLDHLVEVVTNEGLRANTDILCGVYRCGQGRESHWILDLFLDPMPEDATTPFSAQVTPDPVMA